MIGSSNSLWRFGFRFEPGALIEINGRTYWLRDGYCVREGEHGLFCIFGVDGDRILVGTGKEPTIYLGQQMQLELPLELPTVLELGDKEFALRARLPVRIDSIGEATGVDAATGIWGEYHDASARTLWVLSHGSRGIGFVTERVDPRDVFHWGAPS